jgi:hypothetical protein
MAFFEMHESHMNPPKNFYKQNSLLSQEKIRVLKRRPKLPLLRCSQIMHQDALSGAKKLCFGLNVANKFKLLTIKFMYEGRTLEIKLYPENPKILQLCCVVCTFFTII